MNLHSKMDVALENYLALSNMLLSDGEMLLEMGDTGASWRRNFIRTSVSIIEGYGHCFREMAAIRLGCEGVDLAADEKEILTSERGFGVCDRVKLTLRVAYRVFQAQGAPELGDDNWVKAKEGLAKRHTLMHPKTPHDLELSAESWERIYDGLSWLLGIHFDLIKVIRERL